jgi:hypothetical protein
MFCEDHDDNKVARSLDYSFREAAAVESPGGKRHFSKGKKNLKYSVHFGGRAAGAARAARR